MTTPLPTPQAELNKNATPILDEPLAQESQLNIEEDLELPPMTQTEPNNDATTPPPQPVYNRQYPLEAGGTLDPAPKTPTLMKTNPNNELNPLLVNGGPSDRFANAHTNHPTSFTPKRKRSPQKTQIETPKIPRLTLEKLKKPNPEPNPKPKPVKPNPHPHLNQQQFVTVDSKLVLIKHQGLAKTTKKRNQKPKPNPVETTPPKPQKPVPETRPSTPKRLPSKNFTQLAKMFQQHTPPARLPRKPKPEPENKETLNHSKQNQPKPENFARILKRENLTCQAQSSCPRPSVNHEQKFKICQKCPNPPPPNVKVLQLPFKNHLTEENSATPPRQEPPLCHTFAPNPARTRNIQCEFKNYGGKTIQPIRFVIELCEGQQMI